MDRPIRGHCLCGEVAYAYSGPVGPAGYCHCEDCRRCTGSAFNVSVRLQVKFFSIEHGELRGYTKQGASGSNLTRYFCGICDSPMYTASPRHPECIYVKAGTLDDPTVVVPTHQSWTSSSVPWCRIAPEIATFAKGR
jgi:hypothetical protein